MTPSDPQKLSSESQAPLEYNGWRGRVEVAGVSSPEELRDKLADILTGGVHYYELTNSFLNDGQMTPDFPARYASDVVNEIDKIVSIFQSYASQCRKEEREIVKQEVLLYEDVMIDKSELVELQDHRLAELEKGDE